jgi:hypothetical protein
LAGNLQVRREDFGWKEEGGGEGNEEEGMKRREVFLEVEEEEGRFPLGGRRGRRETPICGKRWNLDIFCL